ncbi:hypothetical protein TURU_129733 [Turdus rufiventris]|nr:hypothetical protein TURU_129733 [Turdus rufiventris]
MVMLTGFQSTPLCPSEDPQESGVPQGLALFNFFAGDMGNGIKCILSKSADDSKLCGMVNMQKGKYAIQRDLDRLERQGCANLMKFAMAKYQALHVGWGNPTHKNRLADKLAESIPAEKGLRALVG